ncbi:MAG: hypothetical protein QXN16_02965 [Candidatus Micrarchaeaceae archaeon]
MVSEKKKYKQKGIIAFLRMLPAWLLFAVVDALLWWTGSLMPATRSKKDFVIILVGTIILASVLFALLIIISAALYQAPTQYQYLSANLFPLYAIPYTNNSKILLYPQIQQNGTACVQYFVISTQIFNYTTQKNMTQNTTIRNATRINDIYHNMIYKNLSTHEYSTAGMPIKIPSNATLLCPDIYKVMR